jgi:membrane-associated phospholipid phosphatase
MTESIKIALVALLAFWIAGIGWSRLALGAHYPTDVIGGTLFGVAWACATWAMLPTQWFLERSIR